MKTDASRPFTDLASYRQFQARNRRLPEAERAAAQTALAKERNRWVADFSERWIAEAVAGEGLGASLEWFWFNHFNVFWRNGVVGPALPDFVEGAIRPLIEGRFRDLLLAVITHPAMLVYLDNTKNVAGKLNENLARELLELHTLGVDGSYGQADVAQVARLLTGHGLRPLGEIRWPADKREWVREQGEYLFDPRRHDFSEKTFMGELIPGSGFAELEALVVRLSAHPATARHLGGKLCVWVWGDDPPEAMRAAVATAFMESGGDLQLTRKAAVRFLWQSNVSGGCGVDLASSFKTPMHWMFSALHWLGGGAPLRQPRPARRWLDQLGQPLFGRSTPDGYSLRGADWLSSGQLAQRFFVAREMVDKLPAMWGEKAARRAMSELRLLGALRDASANSRAVISRAPTPQERVALYLSSPEFMMRNPGEVG